ncbi:hypothetical protein DSO57_1034050 [Entomophthora muscae]|uniref:Uncharacterized protein n=1 Tax=Entomophthora muscae TaxID=34485 RepID=A0ACC2S229_9FUNG|nr:hypothetical protein DSO57_1034050 [Entomophthora muscae]
MAQVGVGLIHAPVHPEDVYLGFRTPLFWMPSDASPFYLASQSATQTATSIPCRWPSIPVVVRVMAGPCLPIGNSITVKRYLGGWPSSEELPEQSWVSKGMCASQDIPSSTYGPQWHSS